MTSYSSTRSARAFPTVRRKRFPRQFRDNPATWMLAQRNVYGYL